MAIKFSSKHAAEHGYTKQDWDEASDNPPLTEEEIKSVRPAKDVLPPAFFHRIRKSKNYTRSPSHR